MFRNYLKTAWRSLLKGGASSIVSLVGLLAGMCVTLLVALFILDEYRYDQHFVNKERIVRLTSTYENNGVVYHSAQTRASVANVLSAQFPEVASVTRLMPADEAFLFAKDAAFKERIIYTDSAFLDVFALDLLTGSKNDCLIKRSSVIISETMAARLFGANWQHGELLGQTLSVDNRIPLTITGVFRDMPQHSHFASHLFASVPSGHESWMSDESSVYTYAQLCGHCLPEDLDRKLQSQSALFHRDLKAVNADIRAQPLTDIHLSSSLEDENATVGNQKNLYALMLGAVVLFIITVVNFANLYTARALNRLKEIGMRKTIGALSSQLRYQFFAETLLISFISALIALVAAMSLLPAFNDLTNRSLSILWFADKGMLLLTALMVFTAAVTASVYPSVVLSGTRSIQALKGAKGKVLAISLWRKGLIVIQFSVSAVTITLSIAAFNQMKLINEAPLGFDKEHTITLANPYMLGTTEKIRALKNELLMIPGVEQVSVTGYTPSQNRWANHKMTFSRGAQSSQAQMANWIIVDEAFVETMGLTLMAGRNFIEDNAPDKNAIIINEKAVNELRLNENGKSVLGSELSVQEEGEMAKEKYTVIGVVKDFNFGSMHEPVKPVVMKAGLHRFEIVMRLSPSYPKQDVLANAQSVWSRNLPMIPFEYSFVEDRFKSLHESDADAGKLFLILSVLTIIISAMGLFSIVAHTIANRTREIGVRKVLGASAGSIGFLIARNFLFLVTTGYILSLPFASFLTNQWLSDFAYRINVSWTTYAGAALALFLVTGITLGFHSVKAAYTNPVDNLRHE